jgi:hypothetical protein
MEDKAELPRYFTVTHLEVQVRHAHGLCIVSLHHGTWRCTCAIFGERDTCSHVMAAQKLYGLR